MLVYIHAWLRVGVMVVLGAFYLLFKVEFFLGLNLAL